jgi:ABC-2 type transport system ATP-binding protein
MSSVIEAINVDRRYGTVRALDDVSFAVQENTITGLLGRNGAGKSTMLRLLTGQEFASSGTVRVFGADPVENAAVLARTCFIKESQTYPDSYAGRHALQAARWLYPDWDEALARELVEAFGVPLGRRMKKLSRGQVSAIGVIIGLASRAELTLFDEPYAGLDAVARSIFYDRLLADYAENPRTIVMSTHLIDEAAPLLENVIVLHRGRVELDASADDLRGSAVTVMGKADVVATFTAGRQVLAHKAIGAFAEATVAGLSLPDRTAAERAGLELGTVSLQQLIVDRTRHLTEAAPTEEVAS